MRLGTLFCSLLILVAIGAAQDTNFPVGPQYLVTSTAPMFLRPIATPSLSLSESRSTFNTSVGELTAEPSSPSATQADLTRIYWGPPQTSESSGESAVENAGENVSAIEITSAPLPRALPASIVDTGVTGMTTAQSLRERGFGVPLGETAQFWKAHKPHAPRVYTNADIQRLHPS